MRNILFFLLLTGLLSCKRLDKILVLSDVDLCDATPAVLNALEKCRAEGYSKLLIPKGKYEFYPEKAAQQYCVVSNNDNGLKRIAFSLHQMKDFEIDARGSEFIFHGYMIPFDIDGSENIALKNFSIDWEIPFNAEGLIEAVSVKEKTFDVRFPENKKYHIEKGMLIFDGEGWQQDVGPNLFFDTILKATVYRVQDYKLDPWNPLLHTRYGAKEITKGLVRITDTIARLPHTGWKWVITGKKELNRQSPAIRIYFSNHISLENLTIYHAGAMGIIGERSENISLIKTRVMLAPGKNRVVSTTADATHFVNCRGRIFMDSCLFENMLDDATNIHGIYARLLCHVDDYTVGIKAMHYEQNLSHFAEPGDSIRITDHESMETLRILTLRKIRYINDSYAELTFDEGVNDLPLKSGLDNLMWYPEFVMRNSEVRNNRARSILISTTKSVLVENNTFRHPMMAAISIGCDINFWFESGNVSNLIIRNNKFIDCCSGGQDQAVILINPNILKNPDTGFCFEKNIVIENNTIETFDRAFVEASSTANLVIRNNKIIQTKSYVPVFPEKPVVKLSHCKNADIENNEYFGEPTANVVADSVSRDVHFLNNYNFYLTRQKAH